MVINKEKESTEIQLIVSLCQTLSCVTRWEIEKEHERKKNRQSSIIFDKDDCSNCNYGCGYYNKKNGSIISHEEMECDSYDTAATTSTATNNNDNNNNKRIIRLSQTIMSIIEKYYDLLSIDKIEDITNKYLLPVYKLPSIINDDATKLDIILFHWWYKKIQQRKIATMTNSKNQTNIINKIINVELKNNGCSGGTGLGDACSRYARLQKQQQQQQQQHGGSSTTDRALHQKSSSLADAYHRHHYESLSCKYRRFQNNIPPTSPSCKFVESNTKAKVALSMSYKKTMNYIYLHSSMA